MHPSVVTRIRGSVVKLDVYMVAYFFQHVHNFSKGHIYKTLKSEEATIVEILSYMKTFMNFYLILNLVANFSITKAFNDKDTVHIIDFKISHGGHHVLMTQ